MGINLWLRVYLVLLSLQGIYKLSEMGHKLLIECVPSFVSICLRGSISLENQKHWSWSQSLCTIYVFGRADMISSGTVNKKHCDYSVFERLAQALKNSAPVQENLAVELDYVSHIYLWAPDFLEQVGSHGLTRGSLWKASSSCLVAPEVLDVQTNSQSPTPKPDLKTKTNSNEGATRALRTSIKSHSTSLNGHWTPHFTNSNIPIYDSESILCGWNPSWVVCSDPGHSWRTQKSSQNLWKKARFKWTTLKYVWDPWNCITHTSVGSSTCLCATEVQVRVSLWAIFSRDYQEREDQKESRPFLIN